MLHLGHIDLFKTAKRHCNFLIVEVMDNSFKGLKKKKSAFNLFERVKILRAIKYIDRVISFNTEEKVYAWLRKNKPNLLVTGGEYRTNQPLKKFFENVVYTKNMNSSTKIKKRIAQMYR